MAEMSCFDERYKSRMRWEVIQALLHSLPSGVIESYVVASMRFDSDLLTAESDPLLFLRLENNNIQRAAYKLALSWYKRRACFGEMAFLPMSQVGMSALTEQVALGYSCMQQLPNDNQGNAVYIINAPKITRSLSMPAARAMFYQLHLAKTIGGVVFLFLACGNPSFDEMAMFFGLLSELVNEALPLKAIRVHILSLKSEMPSTMVKSAVELILQKHLSDHVVVTQEICAQDLATKLECFGLTKEGLPPFLGGSLGSAPATVTTGQLKDATDYCVQQPSPRAPEGAATMGHDAPPQGGIAFAQGHTHYYRHSGCGEFPPPPPPPPEGINISQSGSYYPHTNHEHFFPPAPPIPSFAAKPSSTMDIPLPCSIQSLFQEQDSNMMMLSASLGTARTAAVASSNGHAEQSGGGMTSADPNHPDNVAGFPREQEDAVGNPNQQEKETEVDLTAKRERNAYYSRRKYARKKIEIEVRQDEARRLQEENSAFRREQERLEQLILQAQTCIAEMHSNKSNTTTSVDRP